jgi:hypothetical protein
VAPRLAIVGNAAQSLHPIAGQGFNLGLRDAASLAEVIADALAAGRADVGDEATLRAYASWRDEDASGSSPSRTGSCGCSDRRSARCGACAAWACWLSTPSRPPRLRWHA